MKKKIILIGALLASSIGVKTHAQVRDISFNAGVNYEYTWFDKAMDIQNGMLGGVKVGFAFGPHFELHATYDKSFGAKSTLFTADKWQFFNPMNEDVRKEGDIDMHRYGAAIKFNVLRRTLISPYVAVGVGLTDFVIHKAEGAQVSEQALYASGAAGIKFNPTRRLAFTLGGKYLGMYEQKGSALINPTAEVKYNSNNATLLNNFAATAGVEYYFGGYNEIRDDKLANEYYNVFANGTRGIRFVLDPGLMYADFTSNLLPLSDSWFVGGAAGFDFNKLIGIRAFYYQASRGGKELDKFFDKNNGGFDKDLFMYGGYFTGRLNLLNGVTPYLNLGAGKLNVAKKVFEGPTPTVENAWFGLAGVGLEIPLSQFLSLYGTVNATIHDDPSITSSIKTGETSKLNFEQFKKQVTYLTQMGIRFSLGASARVPQATSSEAVAINNERINTERVIEKTHTVTVPQNEQASVQIYAQPQQAGQPYYAQPYIVQVPQQTQPVQALQAAPANNDEVRLTVGELEELTQRMIERNRSTKTTTTIHKNNYSELTPLERELIHILMGNNSTILSSQACPSKAEATNSQTEIIKSIEALEKRMDEQYNTLKKEITTTTATTEPVYQEKQNLVVEEEIVEEFTAPKAQAVEEIEIIEDEVAEAVEAEEAAEEKPACCAVQGRRNSFGIEAGATFTNPIACNLGARANFRIGKSKFDILPEVYVSLTKPMAVAGSLNAVYNILPCSFINPYVGAGVWASYADKKTTVSPNLLAGADFRLKKGAIFAEYSLNNMFKNSNVMVGYRLFF